MSAYQSLKDECYEANLLLPSFKLVDLTFGNVSVCDRGCGLRTFTKLAATLRKMAKLARCWLQRRLHESKTFLFQLSERRDFRREPGCRLRRLFWRKARQRRDRSAKPRQGQSWAEGHRRGVKAMVAGNNLFTGRLGLQGTLLAYAVYRTGSVWWGVGYHASWNWASAPLFGAAGSGSWTKATCWSSPLDARFGSSTRSG